ncbi:MAG: VIT domain-containing protein, partial [Chloroflexota bacterium]
WLEGMYLFPLPAGATVTELTMWVDGIAIESKILRKEEARAIYDAIVRQMRDPALLEYVGQEAIQANVFPIPANAERRIEIEYQQVLPADGGLINYVYPQSTHLYTNLPLEEQSIRVEIASRDAIRSLYSPSHPIADFRDSDFRAVAGFEESDIRADTDFELYYGVSPENIGLNLISYREEGEDGYFMLLAAPSVEIDLAEVVARDIILVMDTSGSMKGEKMEQAKNAARYLVNNLNSVDRFNIVSFSTGVRKYSEELVGEEDVAATNQVDQFINSLEAVGGTNISQSLIEAADMVEPDRPATIIFMTDGLPTEGIWETQPLLDAVNEAIPANAQLFTFGIGNDVDTLLLDTLSSTHRGTTGYVRENERIDEEMEAFFTKISTPVLANLEIDYDGIIVEQMFPAELPDLFAGTQLVLVGRYRNPGPARITLTGDVNGETQTFEYADNIFRESGGDDFIPRLWATRTIGHLLTQIRIQGERQELVDSVINLSLRYGIITPYTSFLIEEDDIINQGGIVPIPEPITQPDTDFGEEATQEEVEVIREVEVQVEVERVVEASGERAVEEAEAVSEMADAIVVAPQPTQPAQLSNEESGQSVAQAPIKHVGVKSFVFQNGRWVDTVYVGELPVERIGFASDAYFDLITAAPYLSDYLAVGELVTVVHDGIAYAIVRGSGDGNITLPEAEQEVIQPLEVESPNVQPDSDPDIIPAIEDVIADSPISTPPTSRSLLYISVAAVIVLLGGIILSVGRRA